MPRVAAALLLLGGTIAAQDAGLLQPPALLERALKTLPGVRLLVPATDLLQHTQAQLQKLGYWPPWFVLDADRDKRPDVVAVVVKPARAGRAEFGVIAVHAQRPEDVQWVIPFDVDSISGLAKGKAPDIVVPLFCVECDSNVWLRWSGEEYEAGLYAVGEELEVGSETQADVPLYTTPNLASKPMTIVPHCTTTVVRKVAGTPDKRWYFVETPEGQRGWIPDDVVSEDLCVG